MMLGALLLILCAVAASAVAVRLRRDGSGMWPVVVTVFLALFVLAFQVAGLAELWVGRPLIHLRLVTGIAAVLAVTVLGVVRRIFPQTLSPLQRAEPDWRPIPLATAWVVGLMGVALSALLVLVLPQGFEARAYHLPIAVRVLHEGTLRIWDASWMNAYPANMSLWAGFWLRVVPERLVSLANLPFLALNSGALFLLARGAGADRNAALLVAAGLITVPLFVFNGIQLSADLGGVACIVLAAWFALAQPLGAQGSAVLAGLAAGLAFGFKSLHLVPLGLLGLWLLACPTQDREPSSRLKIAAGYALAALLMMAYWLIRNAMERGNPLYPVFVPGLFDLFGWRAPPDQFLLGNTHSEREWVNATWRWVLYPWQEGQALGQNFKHSAGLGPFIAATVPAALVLGPVLLWRTATDSCKHVARVQGGVLFLAVGILSAWSLLGDRQPRFFMAAIALLLVPFACLLSQTKGRLRTVYELLLASGIVLMALPPLLGQARESVGVARHGLSLARHQLLEYPPAVDRLPSGSLVMNGYDRPFDYPLLGSGLRNRVMDIFESRRHFGIANGDWRFTEAGVRETGVTHFYGREGDRIEIDGCISLREVDALRANPFNGKPYAQGRVLYAIELCDAARHSTR